MRASAVAALLLLCVAASLQGAGCADAAPAGEKELPAWHPRRFSHRCAPRAVARCAARTLT
jgi:hypothetical protein